MQAGRLSLYVAAISTATGRRLLDCRVRRLIVNADDFGLTRGVNRAIAQAHREGVLTSATIMANAAAFADAVETSQANPSLGIGCHVVLVDGKPLLPRAEISSLLPDDHEFQPSLGRFAVNASLGRIRESDIEAEAVAQISKLQQAGLRVTHVDTHKHTHMFPAVLAPLLRAARACGVKAVRNPFDPAGWRMLRAHPELWKRWGEVAVLRALQGGFLRSVRAAGLKTTQGTAGVVVTGTMTPDSLRGTLQNLQDGVWELVCHPGIDDEELRGVRTRLRQSREQELRILISPSTSTQLRQMGFELTTYAEL
ncbi:MAG: ChbG/HpnK family deacetylase [Acidobacteriales bacterium]|nr:ChbG/HpnK family deacetylase [Terriglobales bacterium]